MLHPVTLVTAYTCKAVCMLQTAAVTLSRCYSYAMHNSRALLSWQHTAVPTRAVQLPEPYCILLCLLLYNHAWWLACFCTASSAAVPAVQHLAWLHARGSSHQGATQILNKPGLRELGHAKQDISLEVGLRLPKARMTSLAAHSDADRLLGMTQQLPQLPGGTGPHGSKVDEAHLCWQQPAAVLKTPASQYCCLLLLLLFAAAATYIPLRATAVSCHRD
jgi:hypothetical protein